MTIDDWVKDEPPAEQPIRQETGGGETCKEGCGTRGGCMAGGHEPWKCFCTGFGACYCSTACRDRAKAKAPASPRGSPGAK